MKRQTKKRHSVQRETWITPRYLARRLAERMLADLSRPVWRFDDPITPDIWAL